MKGLYFLRALGFAAGSFYLYMAFDYGLHDNKLWLFIHSMIAAIYVYATGKLHSKIKRVRGLR